MNQPKHYVSKASFDEVWDELQRLKAEQSPKVTIVGFNEAYNVGILHDRIRELEEENQKLHMKISDILMNRMQNDFDKYIVRQYIPRKDKA